MCRHFAPGQPPNECLHDRAEPPVEKKVANFCDYFVPRPGAFDEVEGAQKSEAKSKLDALFGGGEGGEDADRPDPLEEKPADERGADKDDLRSKLDDLFDD